MNERTKRIKREIFGKPKNVTQGQPNVSGEVTEPEINPELLRMFPPERLERIKKKELRKYKAAQGKKWRNYMESVSK